MASTADDGEFFMERQRSNSAPPGQRLPLDLDDYVDNADVVPDEVDASPRPATQAGGRKTADPSKRSINVICRFRPENAEEVANGGITCVDYSADCKSVTVKLNNGSGQNENQQFFFSHVFQSFASQTDIHAMVGDPVVDSFFAGVNCSVLAYGQTGSGKTYTMMGVINEKTGSVIDSPGLIPRIFTNIFRQVQEREDTHLIELTMSFVELYMERLQDLLYRPDAGKGGPGSTPLRRSEYGYFIDDGQKMAIHSCPDGTSTITNCTEVEVLSLPQAMSVIERGLQRRTTAATKSNKLYLVDLAGSEKVSKTEAEGMRLDEAKEINRSLFALGQVVTALSAKKKKGLTLHIPYRDSKLTRLLENSLGGNALTFMVVTCSPNSYNDSETLSTLRFGAKAQLILTRPVKNVYRTVEELEFLLEKAKQEIELQRSTIAMLKNQVKAVAATGRNTVAMRLDRPNTSSGGAGGPGGAVSVNRAQGTRMMINLLENRFSTIVSAVGRCPLTGQFMKDPVVALDGFTYERRSIVDYLHREENDLASPMTGSRINSSLMIPNLALKSLFELIRDSGIPFQEDDDVLRAPTHPFLVADITGVIMEFVPLQSRLAFARVNTIFARVVYDRSVWVDAIDQLLKMLPPEQQKAISNVQLPAHKVYLSLVNSDGLDSSAKRAKLDRLQFTRSSVKLYSSGLRRGDEKPKKSKTVADSA